MSTQQSILLVVLLAAATAIPRILPAFLLDRIRITGKGRKVLLLLPYTVLTALVWPGILESTSGGPAAGLAGGITAAVCAWCKLPLLASILLSVLAAALVTLI